MTQMKQSQPSKNKSSNKSKNRAKPLVHTAGLTKTRRRFGCGGKINKTS